MKLFGYEIVKAKEVAEFRNLSNFEVPSIEEKKRRDEEKLLQFISTNRKITAVYWEDGLYRINVVGWALIETPCQRYISPCTCSRVGDIDEYGCDSLNFLGLEFDGEEKNWAVAVKIYKFLKAGKKRRRIEKESMIFQCRVCKHQWKTRTPNVKGKQCPKCWSYKIGAVDEKGKDV